MGTDRSVLQPDSRLAPLGSCTGHEVLALVRPVVPYALALSSKRARPVVSRPVVVMAAWRKEEVDAARHRQEEREATRLGNVLSQTGV